MLQKKQEVILKQTLAVNALKGRSRIVLGNEGDKFSVVAPHENLAGYYYMRGTNPECPPMSVLHFTEVVA
ncbi:hypothetical protein MZD04_gp381 [Pseudomonas phage Psa21]|uniref:Uncharacterized protein n=1 Tax=Pseudomonas phage Psa21 TaxID=2530023 RepID=A0A481W6R1_9CAUD|nr:hypothetical protein MZD04_gp381 [Pseudomonas phage Psa21]QBJ02907.1 hypothetical protein PSA21_381 [Pseudomonas phage Psa21]